MSSHWDINLLLIRWALTKNKNGRRIFFCFLNGDTNGGLYKLSVTAKVTGKITKLQRMT